MNRARVVIDGRPVRFPMAGTGQYVANLATGLASLNTPDVDARLLLFGGLLARNRDAWALAGQLPTDRVSMKRMLSRRAFTAWLRFAGASMPAAAVGGPFDVWHATYFEAHPSLKPSQRLVATIHDVIFLSHPHLFPARILGACRFALARQLRDAAKVIAVSNHTREQLLAYTDVDADRVVVIPNAPSPRPTETADEGVPDEPEIERPYALYLGNLEPRKDVPTLIKAWCMCKARGDFALVLAGAPAYLAERAIAAIAAGSSETDVRYLGFVSEERKASLLRHAAALVYPSIYEGFGIPIVEAMTYGLPVIACRTSSIPEVVGPGGILVSPSAPEEMAVAIDRLLGDSALRERLGSLGRRHAERFSWERVAHEAADLYRSVAAA
jgi:glycosyltransferase involved in cell wall biosynthesis